MDVIFKFISGESRGKVVAMVDDVLRKRSCVFCGAMLNEFASAGGKITWTCPDCGMMGTGDGRGNLDISLLPSCPKCGKVCTMVAVDFATLRIGCTVDGYGIVDESGSISGDAVADKDQMNLPGV